MAGASTWAPRSSDRRRRHCSLIGLQCGAGIARATRPRSSFVSASRELAAAYTALEGYFRRVHGARNGPRRFDDYSTQTYNNFSPLLAQLGFCQTAARISKEVLARPKGQFAAAAQSRMRELRGSLTPVPDNYYFTRMPVPLAPLALSCDGLRGRERREPAVGRPLS